MLISVFSVLILWLGRYEGFWTKLGSQKDFFVIMGVSKGLFLISEIEQFWVRWVANFTPKDFRVLTESIWAH